jgi:hypothetical protein
MGLDRSIYTMLALAAVLATALSRAAFAHPYDTYEPAAAYSGYGTQMFGEDPAWSSGDMTFTRPYPAPQTLTRAERYMLFGTQPGPDRHGLQSYFEYVMLGVCRYYSLHRSIPDALTDDNIAACNGMPLEQLRKIKGGQTILELMRNPLTGGVTKLNYMEFAPGQLYVRVLTDDEIQQFCKHDKTLSSLYYKGGHYNYFVQHWERAELNLPVLYGRMYGEHGVIYEQVFYTSTKL